MSTSIRELSGKSWHEWPQTQLIEDMDALSPSPATTSSGCSTSATPTSSRSHSPKLHDNDVMKLPRKDMHIFGQCPVQDDFVLVVCDLCHATVKIEAFYSHVKLRHKSMTTKTCSVDLLKEDLFSLSTRPALVAAPSSCVVTTVEVTAPPVPNFEPNEEMDMDMDINEDLEIQEPILVKEEINFDGTPTTVVESNTPVSATLVDLQSENNVISIPDTEPLPHGMSNDLMAMMGEAVSSSSNSSGSESKPQLATPIIRLQVKSQQDDVKKVVSPLKISPSATSSSLQRADRKPLREYHPDKHCGVWDADTKRHCTRALTCKSHSVGLKRKIEGRSRPFDELVAAHKKAQAEAASKVGVVTATPIVTVCRSFTPTVSVTAPPSVASAVVRTLTPLPLATPIMSVATPTKDPNEESLHYTTDHPRPLAICGFRGARRVGGLIVTGRNHVFTRKLVRVAITAGTAGAFGGGGFHRIRPRVFIGGGTTVTGTMIESPQTQPNSYVLNYNLSGNIKRPGGGAGGLNLTTLPPGGVVIPESFKTDIQDFKGGIKFELGRKIKHILPSGSEVTK